MARMTVRHVARDDDAAATRAALRAMLSADQAERATLIRRAARREQRLAWARVTRGEADRLRELFISGLDALLPGDMQPFEDYMVANGRPFRFGR